MSMLWLDRYFRFQRKGLTGLKCYQGSGGADLALQKDLHAAETILKRRWRVAEKN